MLAGVVGDFASGESVSEGSRKPKMFVLQLACGNSSEQHLCSV